MFLHSGGLWVSDGTTAGTTLVSGSPPVLPQADGSPSLVAYDGRVFFASGTAGVETGSGVELWQSDGTAAGTQIVGDIFV